MSNPLEQYKQDFANKPEYKSGWLSSCVREGFDAAIALELPVKFFKWVKDWPFGMSRRKEYEAILGIYTHPTYEDLYQYWINNVYKPDS